LPAIFHSRAVNPLRTCIVPGLRYNAFLKMALWDAVFRYLAEIPMVSMKNLVGGGPAKPG